MNCDCLQCYIANKLSESMAREIHKAITASNEYNDKLEIMEKRKQSFREFVNNK